MYENDYMGEKLYRLENENINLRKQTGEFGFFGNINAPYCIEICSKLKKRLNVYQWELISNMNIGYSPEMLKECANLILDLVNEGIFDLPQYQYKPAYVNPYYNFGGNMYAPMGAGVIADPAITKELTPKPYVGKQITISGIDGDVLAKIHPSIHLDNETSDLVINIDEAGYDTSRIINSLKVKIMEAINLGQVVTIWIPQEFIEFAHETFKGHKDYIDSAVIVTCPKMITLLGNDIKNKSAIINCVLTIFVKIFNKTVDEVNNDFADLITTDECEEGEKSNNESD